MSMPTPGAVLAPPWVLSWKRTGQQSLLAMSRPRAEDGKWAGGAMCAAMGACCRHDAMRFAPANRCQSALLSCLNV
jgi:hypothetical protein